MTGHDQAAAANSFKRRTRSGASRHDQAVIQAEVRRLARALRPPGVMPRDALERTARAASWSKGRLNRALDAATQARDRLQAD
jgi:hypothetical protein